MTYPKPKFNDKNHSYYIDKERLLSPTGIISILDKSGPLMYWAVGCCIQYLKDNPNDWVGARKEWRNIRDHAANIGTMVHNYAEQFAIAMVNGKEFPELPSNANALQGVNAFVDWYRENKIKFIEAERIVYSKKYNYAGTLDGIIEFNGKLTLLDYKTSKGVYDSFYYQLAAYLFAYEEETGNKIEQIMLVRFDKETGKYEVHEIPIDDVRGKYFEIFKGLLNIKRLLKK